jgi:hypothetical protein
MKRFNPALLIIPVLAVLMGCGGGGDGGGEGVIGGGGGSSNLVVTLTPDEPNPTSNTVSVTSAPGSGGGNLIVVQLDVTGTNSLFGASFDITYDAAAVTYIDWNAGTALETGGYAVSYQAATSPAGRLIVGASRTGGAPGVDIVATTPLVYLTFQVTQPGTFALTFENAELLNAQSPPQSMSGLSWYGGTLVAN